MHKLNHAGTIKRLSLAVVFAGFFGFSTAAMADYYGAIAYSPSTGAHGYSFDYGSRGAAEQRALGECRRRGRGCQVAIWFRNACGALAIGRSGWGSGWGSSRSIAEGYALQTCGRHTRGCGVTRWVCTTR